MRRPTLLIAIGIVLFNACIACAAEPTRYITYALFQKLTSLSPEIKNPRLVTVTDYGFNLWAKGQMRIPAQGNLLEADLNGDGGKETALAFKSGTTNYLLLAKSVGSNWQKVALLKPKTIDGLQWNGRSLMLDRDEFVAWNAGRYAVERGPLAIYANQYEPSDLASTMFKLTYIGPQDEPY